MHQVIDGKSVYVVDFDTMPQLPITGLTEGEEAYLKTLVEASQPDGITTTMAGLLGKHHTYAEALTDAIQTGVITQPGKYAIYLVPGTDDYEIYTIIE